MASTREERQQMRQRGAATRKTKEVDFGFSFGGPTFGISEPAQPFIAPGSVLSSQTETLAPTSTTTPQNPSSQTGSLTNRPERTPGTSRNNRPPRLSAYDIPPDGIPEQTRSNKRRKINPPDDELHISSRQNSQSAARDSPATIASPQETPAKHAKASATETPQLETTNNVTEIPSPLLPEAHTPEQTEVDVNPNPIINGKETNAPASVDQPQQPAGTRPNRSRSSKSKSPQVELEADTNEPSAKKTRKPNSPNQANQENTNEPPSNGFRESISSPSKEKRKSKTKLPANPNDSVDTPETNNDSTVDSSADHVGSDEATNEKRTRTKAAARKKKPGKRAAGQVNGNGSQSPSAEEGVQETSHEQRHQQEQTPLESTARNKRTGTRPSLAKNSNNTETESRPQALTDPVHDAGESSQAGASRTRKQPKKKATRPEPETNGEADEEPVTEVVEPSSRKGRSGPKTKRGTKDQTETEACEEESSQEPEQAVEPESQSQHRGQSGRKARRGTQKGASPTEEPAETEASDRTQRKPREPRGETVPVTIHRLANVSALGGVYTSGSGLDEAEDETPDEQSVERTKLPSRGGVNSADVLSQICRETLEKTLTTLKTAIENESNATRRAEWSRKRKAVETFGMELDGRLLDLSEMLDSNFVLGVQLKKAKRDMLELRSHLHQVRRERETIALQMDRVRSKHMEEENAKTARTTINNSVHTLELALDRSQHRGPPSNEPSSTELEFLLRTMAEEVSSRAPGAQGGLLHQIQSFNAQLESTARQLERSR
ncbi:uncharacterized protein N7469_004014 [Penicillium citrinum]|uniref:Inner kinetochore subunit AME1 domain-containing protein n=1 Tax=Penicillium citrinum TaxID=5077 RepID=A0A9W9TQ48_PENCI|nr:uncharacterized protein N7469_004014 [Penicillium citrinum]KAJ5234846.1 hypothetical protein N7469_004014 [Penicillium citrinum]